VAEKSAHTEIRHHICKILMQQWDPIGVSDVPEAADEYDRYIDRVHDLITQGASEQDIASYLQSVEIEEMGMVDTRGLPLLEPDKRIRAAASLKNLSQLLA
jgi:hypothetical protein